MHIARKCALCGMESDDPRCPRCNALKLTDCDGVCSTCALACSTRVHPRPQHPGRRPVHLEDEEEVPPDRRR